MILQYSQPHHETYSQYIVDLTILGVERIEFLDIYTGESILMEENSIYAFTPNDFQEALEEEKWYFFLIKQ